MQYRFFTVPVRDDGSAADELNGFLRGHRVLQALSDLAFTTAFSVSGCWAWEFYSRRRKQGKNHHESLRAVALRWVKILHRMWRDRVTYNEEFHRAAQRAGTAQQGDSA